MRDAIDEHTLAIRDRLFELSEDQFMRLTTLLERARSLRDGEAVAKRAMDTIRPRLRVSRPPRKLSPERLFCAPFDDLLVDSGPDQNRILRRSIRPCWKVVEQRLDSRTIENIRRRSVSIDAHNPREVNALGMAAWPAMAAAAAQVLEEVEKDNAAADRLRGELGGKAVLRDLARIAPILAAARLAMRLRVLLSPKPMIGIDPLGVSKLSELFGEAQTHHPSAVSALARIALVRTRNPVDLLQPSDTPGQPSPLTAAIHAALMENLEHRLDIAPGNGRSQPRANPEAFVDLAEEVSRSVETLRSARIGAGARDGDRVERVLRRTIEALRAHVLDAADSAVLGGVGRQTNTDEKLGAESHAYALKRCAGVASALGLGSDVKLKISELTDTLEESIERRVTNHSAPATATCASDLRAELHHAVRLIEIMSGPNRADELRRKGEEAIFATFMPAL